MAKIGRNQPCPCGSGKKFKFCHGGLSPVVPVRQRAIPPELELKLRQMSAKRKDEEARTGFGRPMIVSELGGRRIVAVANTIFHSPNWQTFHDFLLEYVKIKLGLEWGKRELSKPPEQRHPVVRWSSSVGAYLKAREEEEPDKNVRSAPMTGAIRGLLNLAYNLYILQHNVELQDRLLARLRDPEKFLGANYETLVAAEFVKAGFQIELEDEGDRSQTHCEFTATYKSSGAKYCVEAKSRQQPTDGSENDIGRIRRQVSRKLKGALEKEAEHPRVAFIDVHTSIAGLVDGEPEWLQAVRDELVARESDLLVDGKPAPGAYVILTNRPYLYALDEIESGFQGALLGYKVPEVGRFREPLPLDEALRIRDRHRPIFDLMRSLGSRTGIPSHFPDDMEGLVLFPPMSVHELVRGGKYKLRTRKGLELEATFGRADLTGEVAHCEFRLVDDGVLVFVHVPIDEGTKRALEKNRFALVEVLAEEPHAPSNAFELFDFMFDIYRRSSREKLLEFMADHPDLAALRLLPQPELARYYVVGMVNGILARDVSKQSS